MEDLIKNIRTLLKSAKLVYDAKDFTSATILYFKAAFSMADYILLKSQGVSPKDHSERFRMLQDSFPDLYLFLDKYFGTYRDTYSLTIDKETCDKVREGVNKIVNKYKIPL